MSGKDELLDKAIVEAKEAEDWQLVEWLRTARGSESAARWYSDKLRKSLRAERKLLTENAKLRELVDGWDFCSKTKSSTFDNCVGCPLFIQTPHSYRCARDERMCELGVEVDG